MGAVGSWCNEWALKRQGMDEGTQKLAKGSASRGTAEQLS